MKRSLIVIAYLLISVAAGAFGFGKKKEKNRNVITCELPCGDSTVTSYGAKMHTPTKRSGRWNKNIY